MKVEERQMEIDVQMCHEDRQFQLQMMQMLMQQNTTHHMPPPTHYPIHSTFNFGSTSYLVCLTMNLIQMKPKMDYSYCKHTYNYFISYVRTLQHCINCDNFNW